MIVLFPRNEIHWNDSNTIVQSGKYGYNKMAEDKNTSESM